MSTEVDIQSVTLENDVTDLPRDMHRAVDELTSFGDEPQMAKMLRMIFDRMEGWAAGYRALGSYATPADHAYADGMDDAANDLQQTLEDIVDSVLESADQ